MLILSDLGDSADERFSYSTTIKTSSGLTISPSRAQISFTTPLRGELTCLLIFIASIIATRSPALTRVAHLHFDRKYQPRHPAKHRPRGEFLRPLCCLRSLCHHGSFGFSGPVPHRRDFNVEYVTIYIHGKFRREVRGWANRRRSV